MADAMQQLSERDLDELKFHWEKWRDEAKGFWRRAAVISIFLLLLILEQWGSAGWKFAGYEYNPTAEEASIHKRFLFCPLSWCLFLFLIHNFIDLLRHRVPEDFEEKVHTNEIKFGPFAEKVPLKKIGHWLYLIVFGAYFLLILIWLMYTTAHVFK
jgi:hypothetical protein